MSFVKLVLATVAVAILVYLGRDFYRWTVFKQTLETYNREPLNQGTSEFERDSQLVVHAVREHETRQAVLHWRSRRDDEPPENPVDSVEIAEIVYDDSRLKMVALVVKTDIIPPLRGEEPPGKKIIIGFSVAGVRNSVDEPWLLWKVPTGNISSSSTMTSLMKSLRYTNYERLDRQTIMIGYEYGETSSSPLVNLGDPGFWESAYWEIGQRYPGKYFFQVQKGFRSGEPLWHPIGPLVEQYPDWIVDMYKSAEESS